MFIKFPINDVLLQCKLFPLDIASMKSALITCNEVECFFSQYKSVLQPNRIAFNFNNLSVCVYNISLQFRSKIIFFLYLYYLCYL